MRYGLVYTRRASKDIRRLEENVKQKIGKALKALENTKLNLDS